MTNKTTIHLEWDQSGRINHRISGVTLPPPKDNQKLWLLAPSAILLLAHQFGPMKPSNGLIMCGATLDTLFDDRYVLVPINSALKSAMIELVYIEGSSAKVQFHPKQGMFANSDNVEEGVRQLVNNYIICTSSELDYYTQLLYKVLASVAIEMYFNFVGELLKAGMVGMHNDTWSQSFPLMSSKIIDLVQAYWSIPTLTTTFQKQQWSKEKDDFLKDQLIELRSKRKVLFYAMGVT